MSGSLRERCRAFLERPVPAGVDYVPGSVAETVLRLAAEATPLDPELLELLELCIPESREAAKRHTGEARDYFRASAALLEEIAAQGG